MRLVAELDAGPLCRAQALAIEPDDDYGTLSARLADLAARSCSRRSQGPATTRNKTPTV